jgi:hypothetical protein
MKQATHNGECQICGRTQKLPNGQMAKHGYNVAWGFFSGTCRGSDNLPFELSKSLVDGAINDAKRHQTWLVGNIKEFREDTNPAKAYVRYYKRQDGYKNAWVETSTIKVRDSNRIYSQWVVTVTERDGKEYEAEIGYSHDMTAVEAAYRCNARFANSLEKNDLAGITRYIAWQTDRIKGWAVKPLTEITRAKATL